MRRSDWVRSLNDEQLAQFLQYVACGAIYGMKNLDNSVDWLCGEMGTKWEPRELRQSRQYG